MDDVDPLFALGLILALVGAGAFLWTATWEEPSCGPGDDVGCGAGVAVHTAVEFYVRIGAGLAFLVGVPLAGYGYRRAHADDPAS